jgi:hypothetical protein
MNNLLKLRSNLFSTARAGSFFSKPTVSIQLRAFSTKGVEPSLSDIADVLKVNYTEEFP